MVQTRMCCVFGAINCNTSGVSWGCNTVYYYYRRKGAKQPDFNTIFCYYKHCAILPQNVDGREQSNLTSTPYHTIHRKFLLPSINTILLPQIVDGREQSNLTSTLYTTTTEERKQSNLTSILYTTTINTMPYYHRKLMEGSKAT